MSEDDSRLAELERGLQLARDQVDELQVQAQEKRKPWYRQTPNLPSLLALLLSISTAVYSGVERWHQDIHGKQEELRRIVSSMGDLAMEYQTKLASPEAAKMTTQQREFMGAMFNRKQMIYLEDADNLVRLIPDHISSSTYDFLSGEKMSSGSAQAVEYLEKAVEVSKEPLTQIIAVRNLGGLYAQRGPFHDLEKARAKFQQAVAWCRANQRTMPRLTTLVSRGNHGERPSG